MVPIFVKHWGDNLQFYPNFALFSTLGEMNLDHDFVQVWKFSEDQKKNKQIKHFFPQIQVKTKKEKKVFIKNRILFSPNSGEDQKINKKKNKKKVFNKNRTLFSQIYAQMYTHSNYWGGYSQIIGVYIPHPPLFRHPCYSKDIRLFLIRKLFGVAHGF